MNFKFLRPISGFNVNDSALLCEIWWTFFRFWSVIYRLGSLISKSCLIVCLIIEFDIWWASHSHIVNSWRCIGGMRVLPPILSRWMPFAIILVTYINSLYCLFIVAFHSLLLFTVIILASTRFFIRIMFISTIRLRFPKN